MERSAFWLPLLLVLLPPAMALGTQRDTWCDFTAGTWVHLKTRTEELGEDNKPVQVAERHVYTELIEKTPSNYTLRVHSQIDSSGRIVEVDPQDFTTSTAQNNNDPSTEGESIGEGVVDLQTYSITCRVIRERIELRGEPMIRIRYLNSDTYPYVFRRELRRPAQDGDAETVIKSTQVLETDMPLQVLGEVRQCVLVRTIEFREGGTTTQLETTCAEIPGELIRRSIVDRDEAGRVTRRVATELVGFGHDPPGGSDEGRRATRSDRVPFFRRLRRNKD